MMVVSDQSGHWHYVNDVNLVEVPDEITELNATEVGIWCQDGGFSTGTPVSVLSWLLTN